MAAAGMVCVSRQTGRVFLMLRSEWVNQPLTWAAPAGAIDWGEDPEDAAFRELEEETGYDGPVEVVMHVIDRRYPFHSFVGLVDDEFEPELNWENDDWGWFSFNDLPDPLHPGFAQILPLILDVADPEAELQPNPSWWSGWHFEDVDTFIEMARESEPDRQFVEQNDYNVDHDEVVWGRRVGWDTSTSSYVVRVPVEKVLFMEGNQWNMGHAAALLDMLNEPQYGRGPVFELPAARLYRIEQEDVEQSEKWYDEGELSYQMNMNEPWKPKDAGTFYVQLVDGNHRALAAMAANEPYIYVTVGENYRDDVRDDEWVRD